MMSGTLDSKTIDHVALLSRLTLDDEEAKEFQHQLASIIDHMGMLRSIDVEGVEPLCHPLDLTNPLREDTPKEPSDAVEICRKAPSMNGAFLDVPRVLPGEGESS